MKACGDYIKRRSSGRVMATGEYVVNTAYSRGKAT
jgi:hypothetical protein